MAVRSQGRPTTKSAHFATLLVMALAPDEVGQRIEAARKRRGWTHDQFRDAIRETVTGKENVNLRTVQRWQKGVNPKDGTSWLPRLGTLMELADLLGVSRSYFVEDEVPEVEPSAIQVRQMVREELEAFLDDSLEPLLQRLLDRTPRAPHESGNEGL